MSQSKLLLAHCNLYPCLEWSNRLRLIKQHLTSVNADVVGLSDIGDAIDDGNVIQLI